MKCTHTLPMTCAQSISVTIRLGFSVPLPQQGHARGEKLRWTNQQKNRRGALGGHLDRQAVVAMGALTSQRGEGMRSGWKRAVGPDRPLSRRFSLGSLVFSGRDGGRR